jgi:hypothetical protein
MPPSTDARGSLQKEPTMRILDTTCRAVVKLAKAIAGPPPMSGFICGECERWRSCGLPPSKNCPVMLEQLARDDRDDYRYARRVSYDPALY